MSYIDKQALRISELEELNELLREKVKNLSLTCGTKSSYAKFTAKNPLISIAKLENWRRETRKTSFGVVTKLADSMMRLTN